MPSSSAPEPSSGSDDRVVSRRQALATLGAAGAGLTVYATQFYVPEEPEPNPPDALGSGTRTLDDGWHTTGGDFGNSRHVPVDAVDDPTVVWSETVRGTVGAVTADAAFLARPDPESETGRIEARSLADGSLRWRGTVPGYATVPGVFEDRVYATGGGVVRAFDRSGEPVWTHDLYTTLTETVHDAFLPDDRETFRVSTPIVDAGQAYVRSSFGFHGLDATTGSTRWRLWTDDHDRVGWRRPVLGSNGVYHVGSDESGVGVQYATLYDQLTVIEGVGEFGPPPALGPRHVLVEPGHTWSADRPGTLFAAPRVRNTDVDADRWTFLGHGTSAPRGRHKTVPAVGPDRVYVGDVIRTDEDLFATVYALDPANGLPVWEHAVDLTIDRRFDPPLESLLTVPTLVDGTLYVGFAPVVDSSPTEPEYVPEAAGVLALSAGTGDRRWFQRLGFPPTSLGVADGVVVAGGRESAAIVVDAARD